MGKLRDHIVEDLRSRLTGAGKAGMKLTLGGLSREYGCSTQPVRQALEILVEEGHVEKGGNNRLRVAEGKRGRRRGRAGVAQLPEDPYPKVSRHVIELGLSGEQKWVREVETADMFKVSRARMRDVFLQLATQGMLEHVPRCGWKVRRFNRKDLRDFLQAREALETLALRLAWDHLDPGRIRELLEGNRTARGRRKQCIDNSLHRYWIDLCGNAYIQQFFRQHAPYFELLFDWEVRDPEVARDTVRQHREILARIQEGDQHGACDALSRHIFDNHPVLNSAELGKS